MRARSDKAGDVKVGAVKAGVMKAVGGRGEV